MPNRHTTWDPPDHQDPVHDLTLAIRGLRMGDVITMPDGSLVRSVPVKHGSSSERRFAIIPPEKSSSPLQRHRVTALGQSTYRSAEETAKKALKE